MPTDTKTLIKILIGAAWIDGKVQEEERQYLHRIAQEKGVANDPEVQPLLYEFRTVQPEQCYEWIREYLGDRPSSEACQQLMESISALIYSDGTVANEEAKLLTRIQLLDSSSETAELPHNSVLKAIRRVYQDWLSKLEA